MGLLLELISLDVRSLALYRVFMGVVVSLDVLERMYYGGWMHYSDSGVVPRWELLENRMASLYHISPQMAFGSYWLMFPFMLAHALVALLFAVGYHTKIMHILLWLLTSGLIARTPVLAHGGDELQRLMLFFTIFLPLGEYFSIDAALNKLAKGQKGKSKEDRTSQFLFLFNPFSRSTSRQNSGEGECGTRVDAQTGRLVSVGTLACLLQVAGMYLWSGLHKSQDDWRVTGLASRYALESDWFRLYPMGDLLIYVDSYVLPGFLVPMTFLVLYFEQFGALLFFVPSRRLRPYARLVAVVGFMLMHVAFCSAMRLGTFLWVCLASLSLLLPGEAWDLLPLPYPALPPPPPPALPLPPSSPLFFFTFFFPPSFSPTLSNFLTRRLPSFFSSFFAGYCLFLCVYFCAADAGALDWPGRYQHPVVQLLALSQHWGLFSPPAHSVTNIGILAEFDGIDEIKELWGQVGSVQSGNLGRNFQLAREVGFSPDARRDSGVSETRWNKLWQLYVAYPHVRVMVARFLCRLYARRKGGLVKFEVVLGQIWFDNEKFEHVLPAKEFGGGSFQCY